MAFWQSIKNWVFSIFAGFAGMIGVYFYGRHSGSLKEMQRQAEADQKKARRIEDDADEARDTRIDTVNDAIEQLRHSKKLRD